jgi:hypothetical protein
MPPPTAKHFSRSTNNGRILPYIDDSGVAPERGIDLFLIGKSRTPAPWPANQIWRSLHLHASSIVRRTNDCFSYQGRDLVSIQYSVSRTKSCCICITFLVPMPGSMIKTETALLFNRLAEPYVGLWRSPNHIIYTPTPAHITTTKVRKLKTYTRSVADTVTSPQLPTNEHYAFSHAATST